MNKLEFEALKNGDDKALDKAYTTYHNYVVGTLINRYKCDRRQAKDIYADTILKFQDLVIANKIVYGNLQAYITRIAVNMFMERKRRQLSKLKKMQNYLASQKDDSESSQLDIMILKEEEAYRTKVEKQKIKAIRWAMKQLCNTCQGVLKDTIIKGIKPYMIAEKYGFKNGRVVTDKKVRCKKKLIALIKDKLGHSKINSN